MNLSVNEKRGCFEVFFVVFNLSSQDILEKVGQEERLKTTRKGSKTTHFLLRDRFIDQKSRLE